MFICSECFFAFFCLFLFCDLSFDVVWVLFCMLYDLNNSCYPLFLLGRPSALPMSRLLYRLALRCIPSLFGFRHVLEKPLRTLGSWPIQLYHCKSGFSEKKREKKKNKKREEKKREKKKKREKSELVVFFFILWMSLSHTSHLFNLFIHLLFYFT